MTASELKSTVKKNRRSEQLSHALYGLIIVTATLVAEMGHVDEASHAFGLVLGTGVILLLAHTYTGIVAVRIIESARLGTVRRRQVIRANLPVVLAIVVPAALFILAGLSALSLQAAYVASIAFSLMALFALGLYAGRVESVNWGLSVLAGVGAGTIGVIVVVIETLLD